MTREIIQQHNGQSVPQDVVGETCAVLEQVRHNAVRLLSAVGRTPRHLRVKAGEIAVEIEWHEMPEEARAAVAGPSAPVEHAVASDVVGSDDAAYLTAPTVGVFYEAPEPGADPFVKKGDRVKPGQQVGIIEAMKLMIPVEADRHGTITEILKANGQAVEYGERLFALAVDGE